MACRAAGTVERSGEKIPRGGGEWVGIGGGVSTGVGVLCILNAAQRVSGGVPRCASGDAVTSIFDVSCGVRCVTIKDEDNLEMSLSIYTRRVSMRGSRLG